MTDLEMTKLCAEAMGYTGFRYHGDCDPGYEVASVKERPDPWWPLRYDAQAMALMKKFPHLCLPPLTDMVCDCVSRGLRTGIRYDLNRGICRAVAAMWAHSSDASKQDYERKFAANSGESK